MIRNLSMDDNLYKESILDCLGDGIITTDLNSRIIYMNAAAETITGWQAEEVAGKAFHEVISLVNLIDSTYVVDLIEQVIKSNSKVGLRKNTVLIAKNGTSKYISASCTPLKQSEKELIGVAIVFRDITTLRSTEQELEKQDIKLRLMINSAPIGIITLDSDRKINQVNDAALAIMGKERETVLGQKIGASIDCKGSRIGIKGCGSSFACRFCELIMACEKALRSGTLTKEMEFSKVLLNKGKETSYWFRASITPMIIDGKKNAIVSMVDITDSKNKEIAITKSRDLTVNVINHLPGSVWSTNLKMEYDYVNKGFLNFTGKKIEDILGNGWHDILHKEDEERYLRICAESLEQRICFEDVIRIRQYDGQYRWCISRGRPYYDLEGEFAGYVGTVNDITDRKLAQKIHDRYILLSNYAKDIILFFDTEGRLIEANEAAVKTYGYSREELLNLTVYDLRRQSDIVKKQLSKASHGGITFEAQHYRKDGTSFPVEVSSQGAYIDGNHVTLSIIRDITERKENEKAILKSESKYRTLFDTATDAIFIYELIEDKEKYARVIEANDIGCKRLGYTREEILEMYLSQFNMQENKANVEYAIQKILDEGHFIFENIHVTKSGLQIPVEISANLILLDGRECILSIVRDISERKKSEDLIRESQAKIIKSQKKYKSLFMNMHSAFAYYEKVYDDAGNIVDLKYVEVNEAYEKLFNVKRDRIKGRCYSERSIENTEMVINNLQLYSRALEKNESIFVKEFYSPSSNKWFSLAIYSPEDKHLAVILTDISQTKEDELKLKKAIQEAEAANKAKSEFLANMSHEIRTPLNGMLGMIDLTMMTDLANEQRENLSTAKLCADSLLNIINDILDFSKLEAGKLTIHNSSFKLRELIEDTIRIHSIKVMNKGLALSYQIPSSIPEYLFGDPYRIRQVLNNLINNAIKFTDKGEIVVTVKNNEEKNGKVELLFSVADTGIGIAEQDVSKLFKSFSQLNGTITRKHGGTGLGLAISKQLVEMMGGDIWVESKIGKGTVFRFILSFEEGKPSVEQDRYLELQLSHKAVSLNILLAEDDPINQKVLMKLLQDQGHQVELASNGKEAVSLYQQKKFDVVLMDIQMPELDGIEATKQIREAEQKSFVHTPIIAITAFALQGDKEKFLSLGMDDYIAKPIKVYELFEKLNHIPQRGAEASDIQGVALKSDGDFVFIEKTKAGYIGDVNGTLVKISDIISKLELPDENKEITILEKHAHEIKELADSIDAYDLKSSAFRVELAARRGNIEEVMQKMIHLRQELETVKKSTNTKGEIQ